MRKLIIIGFLSLLFCQHGLAQRIVVDTTSTNKYLINKSESTQSSTGKEDVELSFGDRAMSFGKGILNRLKARLNLEEAAESFKDRKEQLLGNKEEEDNQQNSGGN